MKIIENPGVTASGGGGGAPADYAAVQAAAYRSGAEPALDITSYGTINSAARAFPNTILNVGTSSFTLLLRATVSPTTASNFVGLAMLATSTTSATNSGFDVNVANNTLRIVVRASASASLANATIWTAPFTAFVNQATDIAVVRVQGQDAPLLYINGALTPLTQFQAGTDGFVGNLSTKSITSTYTHLGAPYPAAVYNLSTLFGLFRVLNRALNATEIVEWIRLPKPPFPDYVGSNVAISSLPAGGLEVGKRYRIQNFVAGDNFTPLGAASNTTGTEFICTVASGGTWTNGSTLVSIGTVLDFDFSGNGYQIHDRTPNKADGTIRGLCSWTQPSADHQVSQVLTANAGTQLLGQFAVEPNCVVEYITVENISVAGTPTVSMGTASGTLNNMINAAPVGVIGTITVIEPSLSISTTRELWFAWSAAGSIRVTVNLKEQ